MFAVFPFLWTAFLSLKESDRNSIYRLSGLKCSFKLIYLPYHLYSTFTGKTELANFIISLILITILRFNLRVLENNHIYKVSQNAFYPLQALRELNIRGNKYKHLPPSILFLPSLEKIIVDAKDDCESCEINIAPNCSFEQRREPKHIPSFGNITGLCLTVNCDYYIYTSCIFNNTTEVPSTKTLGEPDNTRKNIGFSTLESVYILQQNIPLKCFIFILSLSAILANTIVIKVVFTTPRLKRINSMFLAGHIATCDFLIALFLLFVAIHATIFADEEGKTHIDSWKTYSCLITISTRSVALMVEPVLLFLLTLDRYELIVNHSNPSKHLKHRSVLIVTCLAWLTSVIIVGTQAIGFSTKHDFDSYLCGRRASIGKTIDIYIERVGIATTTVLFAICCILYYRVYRVVKNQNMITGSNTYARVSKLIFALVLSTLVLWYVPAMTVAFIGHQKSAKEIRQLTIFISLTTNSLANPFLYVFKEKKFRQELFSPCIARATVRTARSNVHRIRIVPRHDVNDKQSASGIERNRSHTCATSL